VLIESNQQLSNTLDGRFCLDALERALAQGQPDIFNTDQGAQFTALEFTSRLEAAGIRISMDGRGRALDNVFVEWLWCTVKYEHVYLHEYARVPELKKGLHECFSFYNHERLHQSLLYQTSVELDLAGHCGPAGSWEFRLFWQFRGLDTGANLRELVSWILDVDFSRQNVQAMTRLGLKMFLKPRLAQFVLGEQQNLGLLCEVSQKRQGLFQALTVTLHEWIV
jgi:hypothetical protein